MGDVTPLYVIAGYFGVLLALGIGSHRFFRGTSSDYFVASRSIGSFMLLMSVFGTTMTAFALVGSTGEAYKAGIGVYGLMASWSGLVHSAVFFVVGIRLWAVGKRYGYSTQCQYFRDRFDSPALGYLLFPILTLLVIPYLLVGILGAGAVVRGMSAGMFPDVFAGKGPTAGAIPPWLTGLVVCAVVLTYVFLGGVRSTTWANTFQTLVFMVTGVIAFVMIARALGGATAASAAVLQKAPEHLAREGLIGPWKFLSYCFIPLSVGMFPHLFQHWLTAKSAKTFRLTVIFHPICIMVVWVPCILMGIWAQGHGLVAPGGNANAILGMMVGKLLHNPWLTGLLTAGVLAAVMSSLDSQFMCLGTMFTHDVVLRIAGPKRFSDRQTLWIGRGFVLAIVAVTYTISLFARPSIFSLGVWCFTGFSALFPVAVAAVYWKRATKAGAIAAVLVTAAAWYWLFSHSRGEESLLFESYFTPVGADGTLGLADGLMPVTLLVPLCAVVLVVVSLFTRPPSLTVLHRFFPEVEADLPTAENAALDDTSTHQHLLDSGTKRRLLEEHDSE